MPELLLLQRIDDSFCSDFGLRDRLRELRLDDCFRSFRSDFGLRDRLREFRDVLLLRERQLRDVLLLRDEGALFASILSVLPGSKLSVVPRSKLSLLPGSNADIILRT